MLTSNGITTIPSYMILDRWRRTISQGEMQQDQPMGMKELNMLYIRCLNVSRLSNIACEEVKKELRIAVENLELKFGRTVEKSKNGSITRFEKNTNWVTVIGNPKVEKPKGSGKNLGRPSKADSRFKSYREIVVPKIKCCGKCRQKGHNFRNCNVQVDDHHGS